jgi:hypothetical protein
MFFIDVNATAHSHSTITLFNFDSSSITKSLALSPLLGFNFKNENCSQKKHVSWLLYKKKNIYSYSLNKSKTFPAKFDLKKKKINARNSKSYSSKSLKPF